MNTPRETIYAALFALLNGASTLNALNVKTYSRRLKHWAEVNTADQPAIFMQQLGEVVQTDTRKPSRYFMHVDIFVYAKTQDSAQSPSSMLNPIVDAIIALLMPTNQERQTLNGIVEYCRVSGNIQNDEGVLGDQAVVIIPVEMLAT